MTLTRRIIVDTIKAHTGWRRRQAELMADMVLDQIIGALGRGDSVNLQDLGRLTVKMRPTRRWDFRKGNNVETMMRPRINFKASVPMRRRLRALIGIPPKSCWPQPKPVTRTVW